MCRHSYVIYCMNCIHIWCALMMVYFYFVYFGSVVVFYVLYLIIVRHAHDVHEMMQKKYMKMYQADVSFFTNLTIVESMIVYLLCVCVLPIFLMTQI